jgi:hypothetical protein
MANPFFNPQAPVWGCAAFMAALLSPNLLTGPLGTQTPTARAPLRALQNVAPWRQPASAPNLLESTLGPRPFNGGPGGLPIAALRLPQTWAQGIPLAIFAGAQGRPIAQVDWPLPETAVRLEQTWAQNLLSSTLAPTITYQLRAPLKAPQSVARPLSVSDPPNLLMTLLALTGTPAPFGNPDSRLPQGWAIDRSAGGFSTTMYLPANTPPISLYDWPLPARPPRLEQTWTQSLLSSTLAPTGAPPFLQTNWPLPRSWPAQVRGDGKSIPLAILAGAQGKPFGIPDTAGPRAAPRIDQSWASNLLLTTLAPPVAAVPFTQQQRTQRLVLTAQWLDRGWSQNLLLSTLAAPSNYLARIIVTPNANRAVVPNADRTLAPSASRKLP